MPTNAEIKRDYRAFLQSILDTNILISALITPGGIPDQIYQAWRDEDFTLVTSNGQIAEMRRVIQYEHLQQFIKADQANRLLENISAEAIVLESVPEMDLSPDAGDNVIIATAIAGEADFIVTGNEKDFQNVGKTKATGQYSGVTVITARQALERLRKVD